MSLAPCDIRRECFNQSTPIRIPSKSPQQGLQGCHCRPTQVFGESQGKRRESLARRGTLPCPKIAIQQDRKDTGSFRTRQATTTDAVCFAAPASPISPFHQSKRSTGEPLRSVWTFRPMVGWTNSQDKRISHAPLLMEVSEAASHIHLARTCGEIGFHERSRFPTRGRTPRLGRLASRDALSFVDMISLERTWALPYD